MRRRRLSTFRESFGANSRGSIATWCFSGRENLGSRSPGRFQILNSGVIGNLQSSLYGMDRRHLNLVASAVLGRWELALILGSSKSRIERCLCEKGARASEAAPP